MIGSFNKLASNRNNNRKLASSKNNSNKPAFRKNNGNAKFDRFGKNGVGYAKKLEKLKG